jgi:hypothetical protein
MTTQQNLDKNTPLQTKDAKPLTRHEPKSAGSEDDDQNESVEVEADLNWKDPPSQYAATKTGLLSPDVPGASEKQ